MSPRTLRPRQTLHPEAANWSARVVDNGGSVSGSTLSAVDKFCKAIDAAGIRDRFVRLSLMCGGTSGTVAGLNSCLVPLYRGQSPVGTQLGNEVDTNLGPFLPEDYSETTGLQGDGVAKYLSTGLAMNHTSPRNMHMSAWARGFTANNAGLIGVDTNGDGTSPRFFQGIVSFNATPRINIFYNIGTNFVQPQFSQTYTSALLLGSGNASGSTLYANGTSVGTDGESGAGTTANTYPLFVFAINNRDVNVLNRANCRIATYSAGLHMTAAQVAAFHAALVSFNAAIGRA
jgi:hypothetical protein